MNNPTEDKVKPIFVQSLFSIDKKQKIRLFKIEIIEDQLQFFIHTYTGLVDGELQHRSKLVAKSKQGRSLAVEAQFVVNSAIQSKLNEGYKTVEQLKLKIASDSDIHQQLTVLSLNQQAKLLFKELKIKFNTSENWLPLPMLAEKYTDYKDKIKFPCYAQRKYNGVRCLAYWDGTKLTLCSRGGQIYLVPYIQSVLTAFFISNNITTTVILDGELYNHTLPLQVIAGLAKLEDDPTDRKHVLEYHVYDSAEVNSSQSERLNTIQRIVNLINNPKIKLVETVMINNHDEVKTLHDRVVAEGYEGLILRNASGLYQFSFRDTSLIKVKEFLDEEFEIIGCNIDRNIGIESFVFTLKNNKDDQTFEAQPTGTFEQRQLFLTNIHKYIGKKATVRYQERTVGNLPHQAKVRAEKTDCLVEAIRDYE